MGRRDEQPFNQRTDTGRMGFRYEWEAPDERPLVIYPEPFWRDNIIRATYEAAVAGNPRRPGEGPGSYIVRISDLVTQEHGAGVKAMPHVRISNWERDRKLALLREQAGPQEWDGGLR